MNRDVLLPKWGVTMQEATVLTWFKIAGDVVAADEVIAVVETDKVNGEILAPWSGRIVELVAAEGDVVPVGGRLAVLDVGEELQ